MVKTEPHVIADKMYNVKEVCALLDIHRSTLSRHTADEIVCCVRITKREIYYLGEEILHYWRTMRKRPDQ